MKLLDTVKAIVKRHFVSGVLVVVPLILTYLVLKVLFEVVDGLLEPALHRVVGWYYPGLGIVTTILLIILAGFFTRNLVGARLYRLGDSILVRMPLIRPIYSAAKQLLEAIALPTVDSFKEVALVEYPRRGAYALCFVAKRPVMEINGETSQYVTVFVPSTPTPVSGIVLVVPASEVMAVNMTVEEGVKFLVSGGVASPTTFQCRPQSSSNEKREVVK
ncbi:MAG: DUF502 domain-containing protein [candidate division Zixibacteria bacterium]|nr:DUF502 domain-containing protein [candidate division Zixibacteria bacterium]MDH3935697.1 DUF502 domain-containing protein [candidate division Zixibacteria bacterium]MDH4034442.1 DUF502 domain-containing protein [candidate division Zixibacteria bacterium]